MKISDRGIRFIRRHEGVRTKAYRDPVGILTIGVGFTMRSDAFKDWWSANKRGAFTIHSTMSSDEIDDALAFLISREYGKAVDDFLGGKEVPQHVFDAMVSAVFNLGPGALKWRWANAVKSGDYNRAALYLTTTGTTAGGREFAGLVKRRKEEAELLRTGIYTGVPVSADPPVKKPAPAPASPQQPPARPQPNPSEQTWSWVSAIFKAIVALFRRNR